MAESLGKVLQTARNDMELSLRDVERRTGIKNAHLSQIENDRIDKPEMSMLWDLAALYDLDYGRLLRLAGHAKGDESSGRQRQRMTVALRAMEELSPKEQGEALAFMDELRQKRRRG